MNQFFGFSPEAFEQFVRALCLSVFGPGVRAFGNGPDGGREATFNGEVPYPHPPTECWSGYGVIQAKCKEKSESTEVDQKWALGLLKHELEAFVTSQKRTPKPAYYVFVANVELSSAAGGARDQADAMVRSYYQLLPLKGHAIWDANQLNAYVASYEGLRNRFSAYLTPGDVLAKLMAEIERKRPNASLILTSFLERELRADEAARLDQAGNRTDEQLRLARLFFDLPASVQPRLVPPDEHLDPAGKLPAGVLSELLRDASRKLDPTSMQEHENSFSEEELAAKYVLLGGPGSGKSTVGQFFAQIHRAALLARCAPRTLEVQTRNAISETQSLCSSENLSWPATPRYPFRVELNRFAKALSSTNADRVTSLSQYLLNSLKRDHHLKHEDLLQWLATYPWLLILDGLDEVPATSNRGVMLTAVNDFLAEARQVEADLFVVATSRLQGYGGEFSTDTVNLRHILPLSRERALKYVERYAAAKFGANDPRRAQELVDRLQQSAKRSVISELMTTPLQVTFMATVVAARGNPGEDRWQLFDSYYRTIYDRERQKAVPPYDSVLSKQQANIDRLHHDIGFWLQHQGETSSSNAVSLPMSQFERLVDAYLTEDGFQGHDKANLVKLITEAAHQRLVFLTSRVEGELSFEVRSLQEYAAAECLMTGEHETVAARLRSIAAVPYWRNVFLFSVGKCFADTRSRHLQNTIRLLCDDLNNSGDELLLITRSGSDLAIDVLESGALSENPAYSQHLTRIAMQLLAQPYLRAKGLGGASAEQRLARVYRDHVSGIFQEDLILRIGQKEITPSLGAWTLLIRLINRDVKWAEELGNRAWPSAVNDQHGIMAHLYPEIGPTPWLAEKLYALLPRLTYREFWSLIWSHDNDNDDDELHHRESFFTTLKSVDRTSGFEIPLHLLPDTADDPSLRIRVTSIDQPDEIGKIYAVFSNTQPTGLGWIPVLASVEFTQNPNRYTLAKALRQCAVNDWKTDDGFASALVPWPLADCLVAANSVQELKALADKAEKGELGDTVEWHAAETRWKEVGVTRNEIRSQPRSTPFDRSIAKNGTPYYWPRLICSPLSDPKVLTNELVPIILTQASATRKADLLWFLAVLNEHHGYLHTQLSPLAIRDLIGETKIRFGGISLIGACPENPEHRAEWIELCDWLGNSDELILYSSVTKSFKLSVEPLVDAFMRNPSLTGVLRLLGWMASCDVKVDIPDRFLDFRSLQEPRSKLAALLVRITQPGLTDQDASELASEALKLLSPAIVDSADSLIFRATRNSIETVPAIKRFLADLHRQMPAGVVMGKAKCEFSLRQANRLRPSDLQFPRELQKLKLPQIDFS